MVASKRRSVRQAATRKRSLYVDPDTDDEFEAQSEQEPSPSQPDPAEPSAKRRKPGTKRKPATRSRTKGRKLQITIGRARKPNSHHAPPVVKKEFFGPSDHRVPAWTSLPSELLREIFVFASRPIHEFTRDAVRNTDWLLKAAGTCRAFTLPALDAFYRSPAMFNRLQPHQLLELLHLPTEMKYVNYNVKVHDLLIDARCIAGVATNKPQFDLRDLVAQLPQLKSMEILYPNHLPPYRSIHKIQRWTFSTSDLIHAMHERNIRLRSWRWSRDHIPKMSSEELYEMMTAMHETKVFERLERLVVAGFNVNDSAEPSGVDEVTEASSESEKAVPGLANSINRLPNVKDVSFICCDTIMNKFLLRLPTNLQRLELTNCLEITSDMLRSYFITSGVQLRELVLNHNPALSFSFFPGLKTLCPQLEVLRMDLTYYSERDNINDADPLYDELLAPSEVPTWPSTLQHLELTQAQRLTAQAAENLFRSLVDGAIDLPLLRKLIIHAHINIPWRDRVGFRDQWIGRLRRVYLRRSKDPLPYLGSLRQYRLWNQARGLPDITQGGPYTAADDEPKQRSGSRELSHVLVSRYKPSSDRNTHDASPATEPRRSKRVADSQTKQSATAATSGSGSESESESMTSDEDGWSDHVDIFVQGWCDVVDIRIDNQRPRENQFTEGDFLDSEVSGDEDWREDAEEHDDGGGYAW